MTVNLTLYYFTDIQDKFIIERKTSIRENLYSLNNVAEVYKKIFVHPSYWLQNLAV